jgi:cyclopropane fatty-acyl-phospholipid synthase-like methyltransferase
MNEKIYLDEGCRKLNTIGVKCPSCQTQLEMTIPGGVAEAISEGVSQGCAMTLNSISLSGVDIRSYASTCIRLRNVIDDLSEFLNERVEDVTAKMKLPETRLAKTWGERQCSTEEFYKGNKDYLYDNAKYNQFLIYQVQRLLPLTQIRGKKTLDIGCGIGTLVFMLGEQGNESTGYDINPMIVEFAEFLKKKYVLKATFITEKPDFSQFDIITAMGTLEHFENLGEFVVELGKNMHPKALLHHFDDFHDQNISPMHFDHSKEMDKWLDDAGFKRLTNVWAVKL